MILVAGVAALVTTVVVTGVVLDRRAVKRTKRAQNRARVAARQQSVEAEQKHSVGLWPTMMGGLGLVITAAVMFGVTDQTILASLLVGIGAFTIAGPLFLFRDDLS